MGDNLGVLEEVTDLRSIWPHEAHDFTPWLAYNYAIHKATGKTLSQLRREYMKREAES